MPTASGAAWWVYMLRCADGTLYTGITTDVARRVAEHNGDGGLGARYTRSRLAGEPADVMVTPLLGDLDLMEFHRGSIAIEAGRRAVELALPQLQARLTGANDD